MRIRTESGLEYEDIKRSDGPSMSIGQVVSLQYDIALSYDDLEKGITLDSSYTRKQPISFKLGAGEVLLGVDEGVQTMKVGDLRRLIIPSHLAYGERGLPGIIPPNSTLFVDIKVRFVE